MAKHLVFLHIGPDVVEISEDTRRSLAAAGVQTPDVSESDLQRAHLEICRIHKESGLRRKDVEGAWARVCRKTFRARADAFISQPGFWAASADQAALALDGLHGLKVHLVVSTGDGAGVPDAWADRVKPGRIHVLESGLTPTDLAAGVARVALTVQEARAEKSLLRLKRRRKGLQDELAA
jgi:hypothetical protein